MPSHDSSDRCMFRDVAGRRCRLPRKPTHPDLCAHHARIYSEGTPEDPRALLEEILGSEPDLSSARGINRILTKLLSLLILGRLPARKVAIGGYLCQLLMQTLTHLEREQQLAFARTPFTYITHIPRPKYPDSQPVPRATTVINDLESGTTSTTHEPFNR